MIAPEPYLSACMSVVRLAVLHARRMGWSGEVQPDQLADLMDAIHNIPELVQNWETCDVQLMRESFLRAYDSKWAGVTGFSMCDTFDNALGKQ